MNRRFSKVVVAVLTSLVVACGSTGAGAAGRNQTGSGGDAYLMADDTFGVTKAQTVGVGPSGVTADSAGGPQLQP